VATHEVLMKPRVVIRDVPGRQKRRTDEFLEKKIIDLSRVFRRSCVCARSAGTCPSRAILILCTVFRAAKIAWKSKNAARPFRITPRVRVFSPKSTLHIPGDEL